MGTPGSVETYLQRRGIEYDIYRHDCTKSLEQAAEAAGIDLNHLAKAMVLRDEQGLVMAITPASHLLDFAALRELLQRKLEPVPAEMAARIFFSCEIGSIPPLSEPYRMKAVIDNSLAQSGDVYFEPGQHDRLLRVANGDFQLLNRSAQWHAISRPAAGLRREDASLFVVPAGINSAEVMRGLLPVQDIKARILSTDSLPIMPEMARTLLKLRNDPTATIPELAEAVELDPSLAAQMIRYANSAYFGYRVEAESVTDAITRVFGFETAVNIALGIAVGKSFHNPVEGKLGLHAFWRHAVFSAALAQAISLTLPKSMGVKPGLAYLAGLLHNFGFLLLGYLFKPEFYILNKIVEANPEVPVTLIEKRVMGVEHTEVGGWLLRAWGLPGEVITAVNFHHNEYYREQHSAYANLTLLVDHLLKGYGMGDGVSDEPPAVILTALGLDAAEVKAIAERVMAEGGEGLEAIARQMAA